MSELIPVEHLHKANTLPNLIAAYVETQMIGCSERRKRDVTNTLYRWVAYLSLRKGVNQMTMARYPMYLTEKGVHPNSINSHVRMIRKFLKWCFQFGYTKERWYEFIPTVRGVAPGEPEIITQTEYEKLLKICDDRDLSWGIVCGYYTGLRLGDVCCLRWGSVDMERQVIKTVPNKTARSTGRSAEIPFITASDIHNWLIELQQESDCAPEQHVSYALYIRYTVDPTCICRYYKRLFKKADLGHKSYKHFRSTFDSRMANSGMNMAMAAKITGRSDPRALMRYIKVDIEAAREGVAKAMEIHNKYEVFK
jgi:integrase